MIAITATTSSSPVHMPALKMPPMASHELRETTKIVNRDTKLKLIRCICLSLHTTMQKPYLHSYALKRLNLDLFLKWEPQGPIPVLLSSALNLYAVDDCIIKQHYHKT